MSKHFSLREFNLDRTFYTVMQPDGETFTTAIQWEAEDYARSLFITGWKVVEFNPAEGWSRDVTLDFVPDEEPVDYPDPAASRADALYQARREGVV